MRRKGARTMHGGALVTVNRRRVIGRCQTSRTATEGRVLCGSWQVVIQNDVLCCREISGCAPTRTHTYERTFAHTRAHVHTNTRGSLSGHSSTGLISYRGWQLRINIGFHQLPSLIRAGGKKITGYVQYIIHIVKKTKTLYVRKVTHWLVVRTELVFFIIVLGRDPLLIVPNDSIETKNTYKCYFWIQSFDSRYKNTYGTSKYVLSGTKKNIIVWGFEFRSPTVAKLAPDFRGSEHIYKIHPFP